ncbi:hypothetical protein D3C79_830550 [compost metagenome]
MEVGEDVARAHGIDPHTFAGHFLGQAEGEGVQRALGGGIVHVFVGRAQPRGHRRDVDDAPTLPAMAGRHALQRVLGAQHRPDHVGLHQLEQAKLRHFLDPALLADGTGVIDQRGDRPQLGIDALEQLDDLVLDTDVGLDRNGLGAQFTDLGQHPLGGLVVTQVVDADAVTGACGQARGGGANAAAGAGDHDNLVHGYSLPPMTLTPQG